MLSTSKMFAFKVLKIFRTILFRKILKCLKYKPTFQGKSVIFGKISGKCIAFGIHLKLQFVGNKAKGRISKRVLQENNRQIFRKTNILYPLIRKRTCSYQGGGGGGKKCSFFGKFGVFCFLVTPVLRFALLPYCRRIIQLF